MLVSVNGRGVFAMASATPLYRDLERGDEGPDVTGLERFLSFFQLVESEGRARLDGDMAQAIMNFNAFTGRRDLGATFARSTVVWIGTPNAAATTGQIGTVLVEAGELLVGPTALYETAATVAARSEIFNEVD